MEVGAWPQLGTSEIAFENAIACLLEHYHHNEKIILKNQKRTKIEELEFLWSYRILFWCTIWSCNVLTGCRFSNNVELEQKIATRNFASKQNSRASKKFQIIKFRSFMIILYHIFRFQYKATQKFGMMRTCLRLLTLSALATNKQNVLKLHQFNIFIYNFQMYCCTLQIFIFV